MLRAFPLPRRAPLALGLTALALLPLAGCDNPACVFSSAGCQGGSGGGGGNGGLGSEDAILPSNGAWIEPEEPTIEIVLPTIEAHPETVIAVRFSESINPASLAGAFIAIDANFGTPVPLIDPAPLTGDGRIAILTPLAPLQPGQFISVQLGPDARISDLTGQTLTDAAGELTAFTVVESPEPRVLTTWPPRNSANQSDLSEVAVVFDRRMDPFTLAAFGVTIGGSAPVDHDDDPEPLLVTGGALPVPITQVWTWSNVTDAGDRISHGTGATVEIELSVAGNAITSADMDDDPLPNETFEFDLSSIGVPREALKPFVPTDAIGLPDINGVDPVLQVELLTAAQGGDILDVFLFGLGRGNGDLTAFSRSMAVTAGTLLVDVMPAAMGLLDNENVAILADGELTIATRLRRGNIHMPVRLADANPLLPGAQPLIFDVTPPQILGLGTSGAAVANFRSSQRDIVIVGRANEPIGAVRVSAGAFGDNFTGIERPPVVAMDADGLFVARPVAAGIVDPLGANPMYEVRVFDRAFNGSNGVVMGTFRQLGVAAAGVALPGPANVVFDVFDTETLALLPGALVMTHQDNGAITELGSALTGGTGSATAPAAAAGQTIVTVDLAGYDLFTFHGVPRERMQIALTPTNTNNATSAGEVLAPLTVDLTGQTVLVGDGRLPFDGPRVFATDPCTFNPATVQFECDFGPLILRPRRLGHQTVVAANFNVTLPTFTPLTFLRAFAFRSLAPGLNAGQAELFVENELPVALLALGAEGQPIEADPHVLSKTGAPNLGNLTLPPVITVEALAPGQAGPVVVGLGAAFPIDADNWNVRAAYPGAVDGIDDGGGDVLGELVTSQALEADLFLRAELFDDDGNRVGARPRFSNSVGALAVPDPPRLIVPGPGGSTGGVSYNLATADVLPDALGWEGLYRVVLTDTAGRSWHLWTLDPPDAAGGVTIHVPDIGSVTLGGDPLADGTLDCVVSAFAWAGLDVAVDGFLWSDVARESEVYGHTLTVQFTQN